MSRSHLAPLALLALGLTLAPARAAGEPATPAAPPAEPAPAAAAQSPPAPTETAPPKRQKSTPGDRAAKREQARKKMLERFDKDGDGTLNADERAAAKAEAEAKMLERFDADGDGKLSDAERAAARGPNRKQAPSSTSPEKPDAQKPGTRGKAGQRPIRERLLKRFDTDGDGQLSETERAAAKAARQKRAESGKN